MYIKPPTVTESLMSDSLKLLGYKQGYERVEENVRLLKHYYKNDILRAVPDTGDFFVNCVWGPYGSIGAYEMDIAFEKTKLDVEIDGSAHYYENDPSLKLVQDHRDYQLKRVGWTILRVPAWFVYVFHNRLLEELRV
jgi:hypothetical protein